MKILIIDDSALSRKILRGILEPQGYNIVEASDGITGIEKYFLEKPDMVMLDLTMEGMHGLEVLKKIRQMDANAKIVVATADIQGATRAEVKKEGAIAFINKPFTADNVIKTIKDALTGGNRT